jgi:hypothetical protein
MPAAERQLLQDRIDAIARLVRALERDAAVSRNSRIFDDALSDAVGFLEQGSNVLITGMMALDDAARREFRHEAPPRDPTVCK